MEKMFQGIFGISNQSTERNIDHNEELRILKAKQELQLTIAENELKTIENRMKILYQQKNSVAGNRLLIQHKKLSKEIERLTSRNFTLNQATELVTRNEDDEEICAVLKNVNSIVVKKDIDSIENVMDDFSENVNDHLVTPDLFTQHKNECDLESADSKNDSELSFQEFTKKLMDDENGKYELSPSINTSQTVSNEPEYQRENNLLDFKNWVEINEMKVPSHKFINTPPTKVSSNDTNSRLLALGINL